MEHVTINRLLYLPARLHGSIMSPHHDSTVTELNTKVDVKVDLCPL